MTQQHTAGAALRALADFTDELDGLDDTLGYARLDPAAYTYASSGVGVHVSQYDRDDWAARAATIMGALGGRWTPMMITSDVSLTSTVADRTMHPDLGTVRIYVPRWEAAATAPATDLSGLPGLVTP